MVKKYNQSHWNADDPAREQKILRLLEKEPEGFTDLLKQLKWGRRTLSLYLKSLEAKRCIRRKKIGRKVLYSLLQTSPYVGRMLGWDQLPKRDIVIWNRVELNKLDEEQFISSWLMSVRFAFLNIIQDYMLLGNPEKTGDSAGALSRFLEAHVLDYVEITKFFGEVLAKRIENRTLDTRKIRQIRNEMLKKIESKLRVD